jgi:acetoin utilization deacetylase AcuC-like enzyme
MAHERYHRAAKRGNMSSEPHTNGSHRHPLDPTSGIHGTHGNPCAQRVPHVHRTRGVQGIDGIHGIHGIHARHEGDGSTRAQAACSDGTRIARVLFIGIRVGRERARARGPAMSPTVTDGPASTGGPVDPRGGSGHPGAGTPGLLLVDDARFDAHAAGAYHPERPERLTAARAATTQARVEWSHVAAREASDAELSRVHAPHFIDQMEKLRGKRGHLDADTYIAPGSVAAARLAAGGLVAMVDAILDAPAGAVNRGVALLRPPGHHARPERAMGFCLLNSVAVAAAHAVARGAERVLVVDWDVHHGNGTQEMFWRSPNVLYMSTHQFPFYPGTGSAEETGEGEGLGYTVNVPLAAHGGDAVYRGAFERVLLPIAEAYAPDLVLVSAGFDASARDPLAQMELSAEAYGWMARALTSVAARSAGGKIALVLEGGYDLVALESGLARAIDGMAGLAPRSAEDIARDPDDPDVTRAAREAARAWKVAG